jgi:hypothetical protein
MTRPLPPLDLFQIESVTLPTSDLWTWIQATFLSQKSELYNAEHDHLSSALVGCIWTNVKKIKHMKRVAAQAEKPLFKDPWQKARGEQQLRDWFGCIPDFLITFDAFYAQECDDLAFCALVEHELYHCAQQVDKHGFPKFSEDGWPRFGIKGHDVEEFTGIVERYGLRAAGEEAIKFVEASKRAPLIKAVNVDIACGACLK